MADDTEEGHSLRSVTVKLSDADISRIRRIVKHRYPEDTHMMAKVLREMIREECERIDREEQGK